MIDAPLHRVFVALVDPDDRVVQTVEFDSEEAAFAGTMTMTWSVTLD